MLKELLNERTIITNQSIASWEECVKKGGQILIDEGSIENEYINSMIETIHTFGPYVIILPNVAFFHGKPGLGVHKTCMSLIVLKDEIEFTDFENQTIKCAFSFGAIDNESHIGILQQLSILLQDEQFKDLITNNGSKEEILKKINTTR